MDRQTAMERRWLKDGADKLPPDGGVRLFGYLLVTHPFKLITLNLLFLLFSLPIVTMPAALCGLNRVLIKLILEGNVFLWDEFITEFKSSFKKSLILGLIFGGGMFAAWYLLSLGVTNGDSLFGLFFSALGISALIPCAVFGGWSFVLAAMLPLGVRDLLKNSRALTGLELWRSLAILGLAAIFAFFTLLIYPISLPVCGVFLISVTQYAICFLVIPPVKHHIIEPFESSQM